MSQNVKDFLWAFGWSTVTAMIGVSIAICVAPKVQSKFCKKNAETAKEPENKTPENNGENQQ